MTPQDIMDCNMDELTRLKDSYKWIYSNYETFKKSYKNQFIAVKDTKYFDNDSNLERLVERLNLSNINDLIAIEFIHP
ncbi:MAG TPA: hypothetical protein VJR94_12010 [Candidatus Nitrosocosmicus sp.]|nr:hypothetical protein [Candidatus Nitrosocosmicus sp.]